MPAMLVLPVQVGHEVSCSERHWVGTRGLTVNKTDKTPCPHGVDSAIGETFAEYNVR